MKFLKFSILVSLFSLFLLSHCATVKETYSPDGKKAYTLNCSGTGRGWDKCYSAAGEICKEKGYDILKVNNEVVVHGSSSSNSSARADVEQAIARASSRSSITQSNERSMLIACKI
jgi:hypothetical protein